MENESILYTRQMYHRMQLALTTTMTISLVGGSIASFVLSGGTIFGIALGIVLLGMGISIIYNAYYSRNS